MQKNRRRSQSIYFAAPETEKEEQKDQKESWNCKNPSQAPSKADEVNIEMAGMTPNPGFMTNDEYSGFNSMKGGGFKMTPSNEHSIYTDSKYFIHNYLFT